MTSIVWMIVLLVIMGSLVALALLARKGSPKLRMVQRTFSRVLQLLQPNSGALPFDLTDDPSKDYVRDLEKNLQNQRRDR